MSFKKETFGEEIIHIIPLGHEIDRAIKPFEKYKANKAYLLATTSTHGKYTLSMTGEQEFFVKKVEDYLRGQKIAVETRDIDVFDTLEVARHISNIIAIEKARGNLVYVNISSAGRLTSVVATLAAMAHNAKAYYVFADAYTSTPEEKQKHGISICNELKIEMIDNLPLQLPSETELNVLTSLCEANKELNIAQIEKSLGNKKTPGYENCADTKYLKMLRKDKINCHMKLKGILEKLVDKKYISTKKVGKNRLSKIEPTGIFIANISGQITEKKLSRETTRLLAKGYKENAEEDLSIDKDFEAAENELDKNCDK
jgi:hypothetical protein